MVHEEPVLSSKQIFTVFKTWKNEHVDVLRSENIFKKQATATVISLHEFGRIP